MVVFLVAVGSMQILGSVVVSLAAKSAIHEILAAVSFGMGALSIGLAGVLRKLDEVKALLEKRS